MSVIGINSSVTLSGWYLSDQNKVSEFTLADGNRLLAGQVENLVNAMASMTPPLAGQIHLTPEQNDLLSSVLAANWQAH
ncbi:MAG TPA: calcium-binding protein [Magnetospirillum sp.]|nr:calcium-binding protein [Magnetospirillum sp.]